MTSKPPLIEEISFKNFRGFRALDLKGLMPINLIVGHNNTGKTSLLEGIVLLCESQSPQLFNLFRVTLGNPVTRYFKWLFRDGFANDGTFLSCKGPTIEKELLLRNQNVPGAIPQGFVGPTGNFGGILTYLRALPRPMTMQINCKIISVYNRDPSLLVPLIGKAYRKRGGEETFQRLLASVDSRIKKVRIDPGEDGNHILVDIGLTELIPLSQVGQGVYRLAIILADIIGDQPSLLLVDEIENGLHYSVQKQVWTGLATIAKELNVQIFATTHSGECLNAAHRALKALPSYDLAVIQLFRGEDGVQGKILDEAHVEAAIKADIELR